MPEPNGNVPKPVDWLMQQWTESLASGLEKAVQQRPRIEWKTRAEASTQKEDGVSWWKQSISIGPGCAIWVGAPKSLASQIEELAKGKEAAQTAGSPDTITRILRHLSEELGGKLQQKVECESVQKPVDEKVAHALVVTVQFSASVAGPIFVDLSAELDAALEKLAPPAGKSGSVQGKGLSSAARAAGGPMGLLLDMELPLSISFGQSELPLKEVLNLTTGSVVELGTGTDELVEVRVNERVVARGEMVVVDGNYGVRIREIASREERLSPQGVDA